jgi:hypothetical protein
MNYRPIDSYSISLTDDIWMWRVLFQKLHAFTAEISEMKINTVIKILNLFSVQPRYSPNPWRDADNDDNEIYEAFATSQSIKQFISPEDQGTLT